MLDFIETNESKKLTQYLIPANVNIKFEFVEGIGWKEFIFIVASIILSYVLYIIGGLVKVTPIIRLIVASLIVGATYLFVRVEPSTGFSMVSLLRNKKDFKSKQLLYIYKYNSGFKEEK